MFAAVLEQGDEVLLPDPGWPNYRMMLPWLGARAVYYPCPSEEGFQPDLDALGALVGPRTKILVVNSPNNPTGAVYPTSTLAAMIELAQRNNLWLLSDECYDQILLDGTWTSPASLAPDDARIATVFTFSKTYAMTGWRLGYLAGSADLIDTATKVLESNSSCVSTISQVAAEAALDGPQDCVGEMVGAYRRRRDLVAGILQDAELLIARPTGAFYIMADVSPAGLPARELAFKLLREREVSVAPGTAFGQVAGQAVRITPGRRFGSASPARTQISRRAFGGWGNSCTGVPNRKLFVYPAPVELGRNRPTPRSVWPDMQLLRPILTMVARSLGPGRLRLVVVKFAQKLDRP